uniref:Uncharacterized protein n=1 Tax=Lutzomyia longipalpis TaxID=7200 RepID=A0A1B0GIM3_LUTLO
MVLDLTRELEEEIEKLNPTAVGDVHISYNMKMTMIDGKICNALTANNSTQTCYICKTRPSQMNEQHSNNEANEGYYKYGLSPLHARIRFMEWLLNLSFSIPWRKEDQELEEEIEKLNPTAVGDVHISYNMKMTMIDGKICNAVTANNSTQTCYICKTRPSQMNEQHSNNEANEGYYKYGLSPLHARIRFMEWLLNLSFSIPWRE